jgi:2-(1,2-epoxy-1,2-dihydrophenyl)acetyl-CoA isomerase
MSEVTVERTGRTSIVAIHRPEARNAITLGVIGGVRSALQAASADAGIRCVVLTGAGEHFCSGADLRKNMADDPELLDHLEMYMDEFHSLIHAVVRCSKVTIAAMDGCAVGFGADLALACDLRVATTRAFVQEKFVSIGLMPDGGGSFWLPRLVGTARAMKMVLLAEKVAAPELEALGVVAEVVAPESLREAALALARRIEEGPPLAHAAIKRAVYANLGPIEEALRRERDEQLKLLRSADAMEGIMAWVQKRPPVFRGE